MAAARALRKQLTWKFPLNVPSSAIIGDSQLKYVHDHFNPASPHSPAFICQPGAYIDDISDLLDFVPKRISNLILHRIRSDRPDITMVFATPVLPHGPNERLLLRKWRAVTRFNREAREFNFRLLGLHPSFAGVSLLALNFYNLLLDLRRPYITDWQDYAPQPEAYGYGETPSYSQALQRDHPGDACRSVEGNNAKIVAPETTASSTSQPMRSGPHSRGARPATHVPRLSTPATTSREARPNEAAPKTRYDLRVPGSPARRACAK
ncbi:hypothetical protein HPB52_023376 [Rhipicephalus sanguineus]|uniref:Uncharacterized protein n=1 Tax=Rhipicephalus sanguineus TaxID=34632 RepID=A0A9D4QIM9_RHISA|nr:hypothetical protein HPB52_023376 [Rhipicephalus sanguineus]